MPHKVPFDVSRNDANVVFWQDDQIIVHLWGFSELKNWHQKFFSEIVENFLILK